MSDSASALFTAIYQQTYAAIQQDLTSAQTGLLELARTALELTSQTVEGVLQASGLRTDCTAGCAHCCWLWIDVPAHEALLIAQHLRDTLSAEALKTLLEEARRRCEGLGTAGHASPCVLLQDGRCSIYAVRPGACRRYYSQNVSECQRLRIDPAARAQVEYSLIANTGRAVGDAVNSALASAGFDGHFYELTAALVEALEDPQCAERWRRREKVFHSPSIAPTRRLVSAGTETGSL